MNNKFPKLELQLDNMKQTLASADKRPLIGVTQGGSSRADRGAKVAATDGMHRPATKPRRI